jgi:hypothetical protein
VLEGFIIMTELAYSGLAVPHFNGNKLMASFVFLSPCKFLVRWNYVAVDNVACTLMSHCSKLLMLMSHCYKMSHIVLMSHCSKCRDGDSDGDGDG